jgi:hypothetical protein
LRAAAERLAAEEGVSLNQLINVAVAEKLAAIGTEEFFRERAKRGKRAAFLKFLDEAGDEPPAGGGAGLKRAARAPGAAGAVVRAAENYRNGLMRRRPSMARPSCMSSV